MVKGFYKCIRLEYFTGALDNYINEFMVTNRYICVYLNKQLPQSDIDKFYYILIKNYVISVHYKYICNYFKFYPFHSSIIKEGDWVYITDDVEDFNVKNKELWWNYLANENITDIQQVDLITSQL